MHSAVIIDGKRTDEFEVNTGMLQGNVLAPYLFIVVIDWVMRNANIDDDVSLHTNVSPAESQKRELVTLSMQMTLVCLKMTKRKHKSNLMHCLVWLKKWV